MPAQVAANDLLVRKQLSSNAVPTEQSAAVVPGISELQHDGTVWHEVSETSQRSKSFNMPRAASAEQRGKRQEMEWDGVRGLV